MSNSTTRTIETLTKGFKSFSRPSEEMTRNILSDRLDEFKATSIVEGPRRKGNKFCKRHWILSFPWKIEDKRDEPCEFFSLEDAEAAAEAYKVQNAQALKCWRSLLRDQLREEVVSQLWQAHSAKVSKQAESVARVTREDALKALSRM